MPDAAMTIYRSRDRGASWQPLTVGLPQEGAYLDVLREGMAVDALPQAGVYVGTNTGQLYLSADEGDSWRQAEYLFPPIQSVGTAVVEG